MYPNEFIKYLMHFHGDHDYFECHEILEEYWKKVDSGNKESIWVGFILLAVSLYHHRRGNFKGAIRTMEKASKIFLTQIEAIRRLGIEDSLLLGEMNNRLSSMHSKVGYTNFKIPLKDPELNILCISICKQHDMVWCDDGLHPNHIINRHSTRDRSDVIKERELALREKSKGSE